MDTRLHVCLGSIVLKRDFPAPLKTQTLEHKNYG